MATQVRTSTTTPLVAGTQKQIASIGFQATGIQFEIAGKCVGWVDFTRQNCVRSDGSLFTDRTLSVVVGGTETYQMANVTCDATGVVKADLTFTTTQQIRYFAIG